MKKYWPYFLPVFVILSFGLNHMDILHIGILKIKSHELKLTNLSYDFIPGGIYTGGETVSNNNYEDAIIGILPNYQKFLQQDLDLISHNRERIDKIDSEELYFHSNKYKVKLCLDYKKMSLVDSSIFKRIVYLDILGQYELWNEEGTELLQSFPDRKWWIRDSLIFRGIANKEFYENKIDEIWLAQLTEPVIRFIDQYEIPQQRYLEFKKWKALALYFTAFNPGRNTDMNYPYWKIGENIQSTIANLRAARVMEEDKSRTLTSEIRETK